MHPRFVGRRPYPLLYGGAGRDTLIGQRGADVLVGGQGPDTARGGPGRERCVAETTSRRGAPRT